MVVTVGVGIMVATVVANVPEGVAHFAVFSPALPAVFPVLVEDDDEVVLDDVFCADYGAVIVTFLHSESFDGGGHIHPEGPLV